MKAGDVVGHYRILDPLGKGGMGGSTSIASRPRVSACSASRRTRNPIVSRDGAEVYFVAMRSGSPRLMKVAADGGRIAISRGTSSGDVVLIRAK
jgi:hypothetical protein